MVRPMVKSIEMRIHALLKSLSAPLSVLLLLVFVSTVQAQQDKPSSGSLQSILNGSPIGEPTSPLVTQNNVDSVVPLQSDKIIAFAFGDNTADEAIPTPDKAYVGSVSVVDDSLMEVSFAIRDCCYLYQNKFTFTSESSGLVLGAPDYPDGRSYTDAFFGDTEIYREQVSIKIPVVINESHESPVLIRVGYQGCADVGVCYPPQEKVFPVDFLVGDAAIQTPGSDSTSGNQSTDYVSEQDRLADFLAQKGVWSLPLFFALGVLLAFTPCVLPMIPILSGIITADKSITQGKAFVLSLAYVLAMALTYAVIGVLAVASGANLQVVFQHPVVLATFSALFVILSLPMFGVFELQLPVVWQSWLTRLSQRQRGGQIAGVSVMGGLSALIVGPCVAAPLIGILTYITLTGDMAFGGLALFVLGLGMGLPLLLIGTTAGRWLPNAGPWMQTVKAAFGVGLLAVAIWLLSRIVPGALTIVFWAILLLGVAFALFYGARGVSRRLTIVRGIMGVTSTLIGIGLVMSVVSGVNDPSQLTSSFPFGTTARGGSTAIEKPAFARIKSVEELDARLMVAAQSESPVILDFYADWCVSCLEMERFTFHDQRVANLMSQFTLLQADVTKNDETDQLLLKRFGIFGPPAILFFPPAEDEKRQYRVVGFMDADDFSSLLDTVLEAARNSTL